MPPLEKLHHFRFAFLEICLSLDKPSKILPGKFCPFWFALLIWPFNLVCRCYNVIRCTFASPKPRNPRMCWFKPKKTRVLTIFIRSHPANGQLKFLLFADGSGGGSLLKGTDHWVESCRDLTFSFSSEGMVDALATARRMVAWLDSPPSGIYCGFLRM